MRWSILLSLALVLLLQPASAQEAAPDTTETLRVSSKRKHKRRLPRLNGHTFIPSSFQLDPFITTAARVYTGMGQAIDLVVPVEDLDGNEIGRLKGNLVFVAFGFDYTYAFTDWLALGVNVGGLGRLGVNEETLLAQGLSAIAGYDIHAKARLWHNQQFLVSFTADWRQSGIVLASPLDFVRRVIDEGFDESGDNGLITTGEGRHLIGGLHAAYSPINWLGFTALIEGGMANPFAEEKKAEGTLNVGGTVSVDLRSLTPVPVGFMLSITSDTFSDVANDLGQNEETLGYGIYYTGHDELQFGVEVSNQSQRQQGVEEKLRSSVLRINMRYYF